MTSDSTSGIIKEEQQQQPTEDIIINNSKPNNRGGTEDDESETVTTDAASDDDDDDDESTDKVMTDAIKEESPPAALVALDDDDDEEQTIAANNINRINIAAVLTTEPKYEERTNVTLNDSHDCKGVYSGRVLRVLEEASPSTDGEATTATTLIPDGYGTMTYTSKNNNNNNNHPKGVTKYRGHWKDGAWHGQGQAQLANGDSYSGEHVHMMRQGSGTYLWQDGRQYAGTFDKDFRHGQGSYTWPSTTSDGGGGVGATYAGAYYEGIRTGYGQYVDSANGISYTGDWKAGKYHGYGVLTLTTVDDDATDNDSDDTSPTKRVYRGQFQNGQLHGHGVEIHADGSIVYDGEYEDGEPVHKNTIDTSHNSVSRKEQQQPQKKKESEFFVVEKATVQDANGLVGIYRGIIDRASGLPHGNGTLTYDPPSRKATFNGTGNNDGGDDTLDYYEGCFDMGRYHGRGRLYWKNGDSYDGNYSLGMRQGDGVYRWSDGRHYKGEFHSDLRHGFGKFVYGTKSADWYEGNFVKGRRDGKGRFVFADGSVYNGGWKEGLYHGQGELKSSSSGNGNGNNQQQDQPDGGSGKTYIGAFQGGLAHGWGKEMGPDGTVLYEGNWIGGDIEAEAKRKSELAKERLAAQATLRQPRRDRESTTARGGPPEPDCRAVVDMEVLDAERNRGQYTGLVLCQNKKPHGVGRMVYLDGRRIHEGFWNHGMKHGHGRCLFTEMGDFHEGEYEDNVRHGPGKYQWKDGRVFVGHYVNDLRSGQGTFTYPNGEQYEGSFMNGEKHGYGRFEFRGGFYLGQWEHGRYHGRGKLSVRGDELDGMFRDGEYAGKADGYHAKTNAKNRRVEDDVDSVELNECDIETLKDIN